MSQPFSLTCPTPLPAQEHILLAHGEGARLSRQLLRNELLTILGNPILNRLEDGAGLPQIDGPLVMTTDSSVVSPLFFPGGDIGTLAVHSAVNDLAVCGAVPLYLSLALILEEGLPLGILRRILGSIQSAARACQVTVVTGDTKVVPRGAVDKVFINTTGLGKLRPGVQLGTGRIKPGDRILISGTLGDHGLAILAARGGLDFEGLASDTAPLHEMVGALLMFGAEVRFTRDPTRGGVAGVLHEVVEQIGRDVILNETALPLSPAGRGACELLGLDPLHVANEGKLLAVVAADSAHKVLEVLQAQPLGKNAAIIGQITAAPGRHVLLKSRLGGTRMVEEPSGAPLPRIC
jgi:hydrogenase expression/formation protein HypE